MKLYHKIQKIIFNFKSRPILSLIVGLSFLSLVMIAMILQYDAGAKNFDNSSQQLMQVTKQSDSKIFGVVKEIDTDKKFVTIFDITRLEDVKLSYTEGTHIFDKYGQDITISHSLIGSIVDAGYQMDDSKLVKMQISKKAWQFIGVHNLNINKSGFFMKAASSKYKYTDNILIFNNDAVVSIDDLAEQDVLTLWGYEETVWSVIVTKGHGTVRLKDYGEFIGGNIAVGYEDMQQITKDTAITVREGKFSLTVENGEFVASKDITVKRNKETLVSLANIAPEGVKMGKLTFDISPFGADLFIDGVLISYANPIRLTYGSHKIIVSLDGYTTYDHYINVNNAGKTIKITLPKLESSTNTASTDVSDTSNSAQNSNTQNVSDTTDTTGSSSTPDTSDPTEKTDSSVTDNSSQNTDSTDASDNSENSNSEDAASEKDTASVDKDHKIIIQNPKGASVYLDGEYIGKSPGDFKKFIGSHVLTFIKSGYTTKSYTVDVKNDGKDTYFSLPNLVKSSKK